MTDPRFDLPHVEKIEWMIETDGFAVEPVAPRPDADPPLGGYTYTIGFPGHTGFADVVVFGLTPVAARGLLGMLADVLRGGTQVPLGVELLGLLDNDLRCYFAPVDTAHHAGLFTTAIGWYGSEQPAIVQLLYPDRNGFLPYESGFDHRLRYAQPVIGSLDEPGFE